MNGENKLIIKDFNKNFPDIYQNPSKINAYLKRNSKIIENNIKKKFINLGLDKYFAMYANGGFGRQEMFPTSDVDISIVETTKIRSYKELEIFISYLWDMGYKVGHSVRSLKDIKKISKTDIKEYTSYLTRRPIISNLEIDQNISKILNRLWTKNSFYNEKYIEQQKRYKDYFSTAYNLEPDLKESPGTLRDFQTSLWILHHCFELYSISEIKKSGLLNNELKESVKAYDFIKTLRFATNVVTNKNRLNFESQIEISRNAKLVRKKNIKGSVEKMMKRYYEMASVLSYFNNIVFEKYNERGPKVFSKNSNPIYKYKNRIGIQKGAKINKNKNLIFDIFIEIGKSKKINLIDTQTKSNLKKNTKLIDSNFRKNLNFAKQFLEILKSEYNLSYILKTMKTLGILQKYIPELENVIGQMQFDLFHVYTVDEHTFKVVRNMRQMKLFEQDGFKLEHELIKKINKIEILYIAGIFHDLGKGKGGDHSEIGAKTSYRFAKRLGMSKTDSDLVSWLVKKHLIMSSISQKKDISDTETINDFAKQVEQIEKLDYLYLLTINDIRATNPALWNGWKHQLLKDLYILTRSKINKDPIKASADIARERRKNILSNLNDNNKKIVENYFHNFDDSYFNKNITSSLEWQSEFILKNKDLELIVGCRNRFENLIEIFIKANNSNGLFYKLTKILEFSGLAVIDANIFTSKDNNFAANTFITKFQHHDRKFNKSDLNELSERIIKNFKNFTSIENTKKRSLKKIKFENSINIYQSINREKARNLITVETSDRQGLLADIAKVFFEQNVSIFSARINTLGDRVEDTFELENFNKTIIPNNKIKKIITLLEKVV